MAPNDSIARRRVALGLSRKQVGERLGITERQWWRMETGRTPILAVEMPRIAEVLETTVASLYREVRTNGPTTVEVPRVVATRRGRRLQPAVGGALEASR
jgi:transcriptional regulator with XRE-family HTH domain